MHHRSHRKGASRHRTIAHVPIYYLYHPYIGAHRSSTNSPMYGVVRDMRNDDRHSQTPYVPDSTPHVRQRENAQTNVAGRSPTPWGLQTPSRSSWPTVHILCCTFRGGGNMDAPSSIFAPTTPDQIPSIAQYCPVLRRKFSDTAMPQHPRHPLFPGHSYTAMACLGFSSGCHPRI